MKLTAKQKGTLHACAGTGDYLCVLKLAGKRTVHSLIQRKLVRLVVRDDKPVYFTLTDTGETLYRKVFNISSLCY